MIDNASLSSLYGSLSRDIRLLESDRVLCFDDAACGLHFVQSVLALTAGAELSFASIELATEGKALDSVIRRESISMLHASAACWNRLLSANDSGQLPLVALVDVTETTPDLVSSLLQAGATVVSILRPVAYGMPLAAGLLSSAHDSWLFGRPLVANVVRIVEPNGNLAAAGIAGSLQCSDVDSGILARWRTDGVLQYLGTTGSIEFVDGCAVDVAALNTYLETLPAVQDTAVALSDDISGRRRLIACVQPVPAAEIEESDCLASLISVLPRGVTTPRIAIVASITRLADGSIDPKQLSLLRQSAAKKTHQALATPTEMILAEIWQELLGVSAVDQQDNFFELGGTSLMAMQAILKVEQKTGKQISPRRYVIETLAQLAAAYDNAANSAAPPVVDAQPKPRAGIMRRLASLVQRQV